MRASTHIVSGCFMGAEIEPGTFHVLALPGKSRGATERVTDAAYGHAHTQIGSATTTTGTAACDWVPTPDDEEVPGARKGLH